MTKVRSVLLASIPLLLAACGTTPTADVTPPTQGTITIPQAPDMSVKPGSIFDENAKYILFTGEEGGRSGYLDFTAWLKNKETGELKSLSQGLANDAIAIGGVFEQDGSAAYIVLRTNQAGNTIDTIYRIDLSTGDSEKVFTSAGTEIGAFDFNSLGYAENRLAFIAGQAQQLSSGEFTSVKTTYQLTPDTVANGGLKAVALSPESVASKNFATAQVADFAQREIAASTVRSQLQAQAGVYSLRIPGKEIVLSGVVYGVRADFGSPNHTGEDLNAVDWNRGGCTDDAGAGVTAARSGQVISAGAEPVYGTIIRLRHSNGNETIYAHLSKSVVSGGASVTIGQYIGNVGRTGSGAGSCDHLHFAYHDLSKGINDSTRALKVATPTSPMQTSTSQVGGTCPVTSIVNQSIYWYRDDANC